MSRRKRSRLTLAKRMLTLRIGYILASQPAEVRQGAYRTTEHARRSTKRNASAPARMRAGGALIPSKAGLQVNLASVRSAR